MGMPYRARINERTLLNLPGFHGSAFVYVYVEDTSERELWSCAACVDGCKCCPSYFEPQLQLEIADCSRRNALEFEIDSSESRDNSLHKLDTLVSALRLFREAFVAEFEPYDRRADQVAARRESESRAETVKA
jgi:hypothetical protein